MPHNRFTHNRVTRAAAALIAVVLVLLSSPAAAEIPQITFANGLSAAIYTPDDVMRFATRDRNGSLALDLPSGRHYGLIESVDDSRILNKGDGSFHPFSEALVKEALSSLDLAGRPLGLTVNIYILPYPREECLSSSTVGADIMLSPGVYDICGSVCAAIVSHEMGHAFQAVYLPATAGDAWPRYLDIRGISDDPRFKETAAHAYRPTEIFAEDFRCLFGGAEARLSGTIENSSLPLPDDVPGLEDFIVALVPSDPATASAAITSKALVSNYPNPFNPVTTIRAIFSARTSAPAATDVAVYRVDGSLVKRVFHGMTSGGELTARWDGTDERGGSVTSGVYLYVVIRGSERASGKMLLVR